MTALPHAVGYMCRRPIEDWERPYLSGLGRSLRDLRIGGDRPVSPALVSSLAEMHRVHLWRIERGLRRTRRSTLDRLAAALTKARPELGAPARIAARLAAEAGPALAPESNYRARVQRRRHRRWRKKWSRGEWRIRGIAHANHTLHSPSHSRPSPPSRKGADHA